MGVLIVNQSSRRAPRKFIQIWATKIFKELCRKKIVSKKIYYKEITVVFLDSRPAQKLNMQYRQKNYATDVLSFESLEETSLGELVMCPEVLRDQAREHGLTYQQELGYMLLHGILHLLGYDHEKSSTEAQKMLSLQDEIFEKLLKKSSISRSPKSK